MAARTISELANWDGRRDQQRQSSKWRRSSSSRARDPYNSPLESPSVDIFQSSGRFSDQKHAEQSAFCSSVERGSLANSSANARLSSRVDTTPKLRPASVAHAAPSPALQPLPFIVSSKPSHLTPNSSLHVSRVHNPRPVSRAPVALSQSASMVEPEVIDLTLEDTEDELSVSDMLIPSSTTSKNPHADLGPSRQILSSRRSSPIALEQSLFTPPPPSRRRTRLLIDHVAVPSFPEGLTKADYQPMFDHSVVPLPDSTLPSALRRAPLAGSPATEEHTVEKRKGKERELDVVSSPEEYEQRSVVPEVDGVPDAFLGTLSDYTMIPLYDDDTYPPLTTLDLLTNTRFQFAHAWREHASRLRETEFDWMFKFRLLGESCTWARSVNASSPRLPETAGYVSSEQLRPWELALLGCLPQESLNDQASLTDDHPAVELDPNTLLLPDDPLPGASPAVDPAVSNSIASQGSTLVDMEHDMHRYFNGLGDSPAMHVAPRQRLSPTHTFRPHLLRSARHAQMNSLGLAFPSSEPDLRLADTGNFLGVPQSPFPADMRSSISPGPISPPLGPSDYFPASPSNIFDASPTDAWSIEHDSLPNDDVAPTASSTIDPSLLGPEQGQERSQTQTNPTPTRRSKLPEPVIYIRRPIDSSSLPMLSGKRPVQIKYRDSGGHSATPSTQTPTDPTKNSKQSYSNTDDLPRTKRHSAPSQKLRQHMTASESDPDYIPETSTPKLKIKIKRPRVKDKESVVEHQGVSAENAPIMSSCHQCRNTTVRPKMLCSNVVHGRVCGKRFCNRCILYRYPDITFDEHSAGFLCPVCTNTCNCSNCSRSRGEEFISMRLGGLAASLFKTKVTLVRDVGQPVHRTQSPPPRKVDARRSASAVTTPTPQPNELPTQTKFWAHVYGLEGERMGSAFMTREHMERLQTRGPPPSILPKEVPKKERKPRKRNKEREKPRGPRVFVGRPLESWKVRTVRDLEPSVDATTGGTGEGTGRETGAEIMQGNRRRRRYIGDPAPLYEPYGRMPSTASPTSPPSSRCSTPEVDSDGTLTPLSELEAEAGAGADNWPQPEVGECCSWVPLLQPPGAIVYPGPSDPSGLQVLVAREQSGSEPPGTAGLSLQVDGLQGLGLEFGSSAEMDVDVEDEPASASTALSEEDLARAISAALAALSVEPPS